MSQTLTRQAYERLVAELDELTTRGRIDIARVIEEARALGDLRENGDYHAAKDTQGKMEARIRQIESILKDAIVLDGAEVRDDISVGCVITLRYVGDEDTEEYFFGSIEEKREGMGTLSPSSPLGQSIEGKKVGDIVSYQAPGGELQVEVVAIDR
ncbi:MAG: transcription elongation factor GreA [Actinomycetota bacterium]|nr:transcription elongation factor GreA [Actinomycetota bacterium]